MDKTTVIVKLEIETESCDTELLGDKLEECIKKLDSEILSGGSQVKKIDIYIKGT